MKNYNWLVLMMLAIPPAHADGESCPCPPPFPTANELFHRVVADPREAQTEALYHHTDGMNLGDVALGDTWGLKRWYLGPQGEVGVQSDIEGMAYSIFKMTGGINYFETVDFFANLPVEVRYKDYSGRFTLFHQSSHLGDDYIRISGQLGDRYSVEGVKQLFSYEPTETFRVYGGGSYLFHHIPTAYKPGMFQGGIELTSRDLREHLPHARLYLAEDLQSKEALQWNVNSNTELGIRLGYDGVKRVLRVFLAHFEGHSEFAQFYTQRYATNSVGIAFDF